MRSKASIRGHPVHPALIPFPLAFLTGGFVFDLIGVLAGRPALWTTGGYLVLAGIGTALLAAVPGFIDYVATVPPRSSGKRRATQHLASNLGAVLAFALALGMRGGVSVEPAPSLLVLEAVGALLLGIGGWLGGTLVVRNQIGIDHRYAHAGRWRETRAPADDAGGAVVARSGELEMDQMKLVHVDGRRIVVGRTSEGYVAFDDSCTHRGASLADGTLMCGVVQCPWHGSQFHVRTGEVRAGPATRGIRRYEVTEADGEVTLRWRRAPRAAPAGVR